MDIKGEFLIGVSILVKSIVNGMVIDIDGFFKINLKIGRDIIVVFYIGFEIKEVLIDNFFFESFEI